MTTRYISKIAFFFVFLGCLSCSSELDIFPEDAIATSDLTSDDLESTLNGVLANFRNTYADDGNNSLVTDFDLLAGNLKRGPLFGISSFETTNIPTTDAYVETVWSDIYDAIFSANTMLSVIGDQSGFDYYRSSALYLRSLGYYWLVTRYGGVPLVTNLSEALNQRASTQETWNLIISDLNTALSLSSGFSSPFLVSNEAIKALLARVHLYTGSNAEAERFAEEVINSGQFELIESFGNNFGLDASRELIFGFSNVDEFSIIHRIFTTNDHPNPGSQVLIPTDFALNELFSAEDTRAETSVILFNDQPMVNKWANNKTAPLVVSRMGELYLISAEAMGYPAGLERLNELRAIRGLAAVSPTSQEEFIDAIVAERRLELYGEGFFYYDLVRTGRAEGIVTAVSSANDYLWPIPQREVDLAGYTQNPGY